MRVPTLYLRHVPAAVVTRLRRRARRNGRSMNAEAVALLQSALDEEYDPEEWIAEFRRLQFSVPGSPETPELIRAGRDDELEDDRPRR
jgi:plasmid stability protein